MENNAGRICVCIPVRNGSKTITQTLYSISDQDYDNIQILICDNASDDNTRECVISFQSTCKIDLSYIYNPTIGSAEENFNFCLQHIPEDVEYVALYHADDIYLPSIISKQIAFLTENDVSIVFTLSRLINDVGNDITKKRKYRINLPFEVEKNVFDYTTLLNLVASYNNFLRTPAFLFKRNIIKSKELYFCTRFKSSADLDLFLRLSKKYCIGILTEPLHLYRVSQTQGSYVLLNNRTKLADYFDVMDYHIEQHKSLNNNSINRYQATKAVERIICAINSVRKDESPKATSLMKEALTVKNGWYILKIGSRYGMKHYCFGLVLRMSIFFKVERLFLSIFDNIHNRFAVQLN